MDATESLLEAWRTKPDADRAAALCRVLGSRAGDSAEHRRILSDVAPRISNHHAGDLPVLLELARACIAAGDMFLADAVLKPLLQAAPNEPKVWRLLGEVFLRAGNARDAETAFEGAMARGLRDTDTLRWHEKARGSRGLQDSAGPPAVAAEIGRWTGSWRSGGGASTPVPAPAARAPATERLVESPDSQRTVIREPPSMDLDQTIIREPLAADLASARSPDSERTGFYQKPDASDGPTAPVAPPPQPAFPPPRPASPPRAASPPVAAPLPRAAPAAAPPTPAAAPPAAAGDKSFLEEESMDIDVLKLPEGDKLDEMLEALRKSEGLVIEEPTGFYQVPPAPKLDLGAPAPKAAQVQFGTMLMTPAEADVVRAPLGGGGIGHVPPPPPLPVETPNARVESTSGPGRAVESPSGVIINAQTDPIESGFGVAPTVRGPSGYSSAPGGYGGFTPVGPDGVGVSTLPGGPGGKATTLRPPKKGRAKIWVAVLLLLGGLGGGGWYLVRVRGMKFGAADLLPVPVTVTLQAPALALGAAAPSANA